MSIDTVGWLKCSSRATNVKLSCLARDSNTCNCPRLILRASLLAANSYIDNSIYITSLISIIIYVFHSYTKNS
jgi:hypothetical protein